MHNAPEDKSIYGISNYTFTVIGALGFVLLFAIIMMIAYMPNRPKPVEQEIIDKRWATLSEVNSKQEKLVTSYEWINKEEGEVRIPVERAKDLVISELAK